VHCTSFCYDFDFCQLIFCCEDLKCLKGVPYAFKPNVNIIQMQMQHNQ